MIKIKEFVKAKSLEEAYELNQKKRNRIIGGMMWLKMSRQSVDTAIDLSGLGLDTVEETDSEFRIGCMVTLRQLETDASLNKFTNNAVRDAVKSIVGVQFRNLATVGGSIFGRYGFSDVLTVFTAMKAYAELYRGGIVPLAEFAQMKYDRDILVRLIVKKTDLKIAYFSQRNAKTDFPVIAVAVARDENGLRAAVGARPHRAVLVEFDENTDIEALAKRIETGSNMRAGAEYRTHLIKVFLNRGLKSLEEKSE